MSQVLGSHSQRVVSLTTFCAKRRKDGKGGKGSKGKGSKGKGSKGKGSKEKGSDVKIEEMKEVEEDGSLEALWAAEQKRPAPGS